MALNNNKSPKVETSYGEDRISKLPDTILHHILSFLSTKEAFASSILSTRWRCLFNSIPTLNFDVCEQGGLGHARDDAKQAALRVMNFVDRVLLHRNVLHIQKVSFFWDEYFDQFRVNGWISTVISRRVEKLTLHHYAYSGVPYGFPCCVFSSDSLTMLDIHMESVLKLPRFISLPNLKILRLTLIVFGEEHSLEQLLSNCPVLEELILSVCSWINMVDLGISSPTLKSLKIGNTGCEDGLRNCKVMISAPSLASFVHIGSLAKDYIFPCKSMLVDATIIFREVPELQEGAGYAASKLLDGISNVEFLNLSDDTLKVISSIDFNSLQNLLNLHELELFSSINLESDGKPLWDLINVSPNLESLIFAKVLDVDNADRICDLLPDCLVPLLKAVELRKFDGSKTELDLVEWFLENSRVLERMTIVSSDNLRGNLQDKINVMERLLILPRASPKCKLEFS